MDREILYRAKFGNEWKYGYLSVEPKGLVIKEPYELNQSNIWHIDHETVGQYTGLTDKNGCKIFEGDIIKGVVFSTNFIGVITWIDEIAGFGVRYFNSKRTPTAWENSSILKMIQRGHKDKFAAELIGNIHDNPELIKQED